MKKLFSVISIFLIPLILHSQNNQDILLKARAHMDHGRYEAAVSLLSGELLKKEDSGTYLFRGDAYAASGKYSEALSDYNSATRLAAGSGEYGLARIYALKGDVKTSLYHLELNIGSSFRKTEKEIMLDPVFGTIENTPEWRLFWKKERYSESEQKLAEIEYSISAGRKGDAASDLAELNSKWPGDDQTLYAKALYDLSEKKYQEAVTGLIKLVSADKNNLKYLYLLARAQYESGNPAGASDVYGTIISMGTIDAKLFFLRAECYRKTGEYDKALTDLNRYLELYPENREALSLAGKTASESGDNLKALELYSKNLKLHPNDAACYIDRANAFLVSRTWENAITDYTMALDLKPDDPDVWLNKGIAQLSLGKTEDACHDFRRALSLGNKKAAALISRNCIK